MLLLLSSTAVSILLIAVLAHHDPKRRRTAGLAAGRIGSNGRRVLAAAAIVPGLAWAAIGDSSAFLVWLGGCAIGGWCIAQIGRARAG